MSDSGGIFGFIDILKRLPVLPKIIMYVGLLILILGILSPPFSLLRNPKIAAGAGTMVAAVGVLHGKNMRWSDPSPPYPRHWDFVSVIKAAVYFGISAVLFRIAYLAS